MRAGVVLLLAGLVGCSFTRHLGDDTATGSDGGDDAGSGVDGPGTWLAGFTSRHPIDLGATVMPATDFPLAIRVAAGDASLVSTDPNAVVAITADDGTTALPLDVEHYDPTTGALAVWVRVPALAAGGRLWLYGGGHSGTLPPAGLAPVWDPARYQAVWHMGDSDGGGLTTVLDRTSDGEDLVARSSPGTPAGADALVGRGRAYDGNDDVLAHDDVSNGMLDFGTHSGTITLWVWKDHSAGPYDVVLIKGNASVMQRGYDLELGANGWVAYISDGVHVHQPTFGAASTFFGDWVALAVVIDREQHELRLYANAALVAHEDIADLGNVTGTDSFQLGLDGYDFAGLVDEVRLAGVAEDAAWLADEHANLADPTFMTIGPAETR